MVQAIQIDNDIIPVTESQEYEYTMTTAQVAKGYGVSESVIRDHKRNHSNELLQGKHWFSSVENIDTGNLKGVTTNWTKKGVVRLGFFIRSERAIKFRDMAEDLVLNHLENKTPELTLKQAYDMVKRDLRFRKISFEHALMYPKERYATPSKVNGRPKTKLVKSHWRTEPIGKIPSPSPFERNLFNYLDQ